MSQSPDSSNGEPTANDPASPGPRVRSLGAIFELLVPERRRNALYVLYRHSEPMALADLAEEVAALEDAPTERVAAGLHHVHVPRLAEEGVAEYDADDGLVGLSEPSDRFRAFLEAAAENESCRLRNASESATLSEF
jgi:hypothetical protein